MATTAGVDETAQTHPTVRRIETLGRLLDGAVRVPGTEFRIGLDPILGILPGAGDTVASVLSLYIVFEAYRADVPRATLLKMLSYVAVDTVIGSIPVLGTIFDAVWKANQWNARLLADHLEYELADQTVEQLV